MPKLIFSCRFSKINQDVIAQLINTNQYQTDLNFVFIGFLFNFIYQKVHNYSALMENAFFAKKGKQNFFLNIKIFKTYIMENQAQNHCSEWQR